MIVATQTEDLIKGLSIEVAVLKDRVKALRSRTDTLHGIAGQISIIEHQLAEMTKTKELWGQRGWMVLTICLSALFSFLAVISGSLLTFYLNSKR